MNGDDGGVFAEGPLPFKQLEEQIAAQFGGAQPSEEDAKARRVLLEQAFAVNTQKCVDRATGLAGMEAPRDGETPKQHWARQMQQVLAENSQGVSEQAQQLLAATQRDVQVSARPPPVASLKEVCCWAAPASLTHPPNSVMN
eukprot:COSAG01_NODE_2784_length_7083_cov_306.080756_1_plen_142_part_00